MKKLPNTLFVLDPQINPSATMVPAFLKRTSAEAQLAESRVVYGQKGRNVVAYVRVETPAQKPVSKPRPKKVAKKKAARK